MKIKISTVKVYLFVLQHELAKCKTLFMSNILYFIPQNGADDVKRHRWFKHLNWNDVYSKKLKVSFKGPLYFPSFPF